MKNNFVSFAVGVLFAIGLAISGMTKPDKVIGFLDFFGHWDPALLWVMVGAIGIHGICYYLINFEKSPLLAEKWCVPTNKKISISLILGSLIFGVGWGLAGYCPGPGVVSLASLNAKPFIFVLSLIAGMLVFKVLDRKYKFKR